MLKIIYRPANGKTEELSAARVQVGRDGAAPGIRLYATEDSTRAFRHFKDGAGGLIMVENEKGLVIDTYHV